MTIDYTDHAPEPILGQLPALFAAVGWKPRQVSDLQTALARSDAAVFALAEGRLVGFGRMFSDGVYYAWIVDVIVAPEFQRRGVGREIVTRLAARRTTTTLSLVASDDVAGFYRRIGWHPADSGMFIHRGPPPAPPRPDLG